jgi:predicted nucleotidyltransferase
LACGRSDRGALSEVAAYHRALVERLRALLGEGLAGVYAGGSYALGGYDSGRSDLDVAVVCRHPLCDGDKVELVDALRHEALPCPARGLELVVYTKGVTREGTPDAGYELNLNTGLEMPFHSSFSPGAGDEHWYAIDRAIIREHGVALFGPPPRELFAPLPRHSLLRLLSDSVRWHEEHDWAPADDAILNACRAWRFAVEGVWSSKPAAGEWARARLNEPDVVSEALAASSGEGRLDRARVEEFLVAVQGLLAAAAENAGGLSHS